MECVKTMPSAVKDIKSYLLFQYKNKEDRYAVGSIERDKYIEVSEDSLQPIMQVIDNLDGTKSAAEIEKEILLTTGNKIEVDKICNVLDRAGLLEDSKNTEKSELDLISVQIADFCITNLYKLYKFLSKFSLVFAIIIPIIVISALIFGNIFNNIAHMSLVGFNDNYIMNISALVLTSVLSLVIHETAHGVMAVKYGLKPSNLIISLYLYISPMVYLKIPGMYTVKPKQRIAIWGAGMVMNAALFGIGLLAYNFLVSSGYSGFIVYFFQYLCYMNLMFIITNISPLMPLDGYFMLTTFLKIPNLRKKSFTDIKNFISTKRLSTKTPFLVYFLFSISAMGLLIFRELFSIVNLFSNGFENNGLIGGFLEIKLYIAMLVFVFIGKIRTFYYKRNNNVNNITQTNLASTTTQNS